MDFLDLCKKIILIDSSPRAGTEEIALFAKDICESVGLDVTLQEARLAGKNQFNVIARPKNSSKKNEVIFQTHLDTVEPGLNASWTETENNAFKATIKDGKIFGLGTADVKLDFLCKLRALKDFASEKSFKRPFALVGTYGEEMGMEGSKLLLSSKFVDPKMALIGEPSELQIVHANNGYGVCTFEIPFLDEELQFHKHHAEEGSILSKTATTQEKVFHGKAAHSSTPHLGENALLKLVEYIDKLPAGIGILQVSGGTVANTVPANAQIEIDAGFILLPGKLSAGIRIVKLVRELQRLEREFLNFETPLFSPSHPTLNFGVCKTLPDCLRITVSFRFTPQIDKSQVNIWWDRLSKFSIENLMTFKPDRLSESALTPLNSELIMGAIAICKSQKLRDKPITKASGTECSVYGPYGVDCMVLGPGVSIGNSHTANEYNILSQLDQASDFYREAVKRFCL